jgi:phosphoribosylformylglycinamidine cyclo-ligase
VARLKPSTRVAEIGGRIGDVLLRPHRCYWPLLKNIVARGWLGAMAHITGGGITENLPRVLPRGTQAVVELGSWPVPPIFRYLRRLGKISQDEMLRTFNCGVGMILVVPLKHVKKVEAELKRRREKFFCVGRIEHSPQGPYVTYLH